MSAKTKEHRVKMHPTTCRSCAMLPWDGHRHDRRGHRRPLWLAAAACTSCWNLRERLLALKKNGDE